MTENIRSRDLVRRAKRKDKLKTMSRAPKHDKTNDGWYQNAYQRFSIFLRISQKLEQTSDI